MIERMGVIRIPTFSGERLRSARHARRWSQGRLAVEIGVRLTTISAWERGLRTPEPPTFLALAKVLNLQPEDLLAMPTERFTLAELRAVAGLHQRDVALKLGVQQVRISNFESGYERPTDELMEELAEAYNVNIDQAIAGWERGRERLMKQD